ncbi:MAG: integrase catalytic domain-containing protein [Sulfobacillus sp.]
MAGRGRRRDPLEGVRAMALSRRERQAVLRDLASRYGKARKGEKGVLLHQVVEVLGLNRHYAARALRRARAAAVAKRRPSHGGGRKPMYSVAAKAALRQVWAVMDFASGKRLAPFMKPLVEALERHGEISLETEVRAQLLAMSAASIDRFLAPDRRQLEIRGRTGTKPGNLLKNGVPIRTFADWDDARPGFLEIDLVSHEGGNPRGEFCQTLDMVDVSTGWTETQAVPNKAQRWVFEALKARLPRFPFPILGLDSDNGSEFINNQLIRYCEQQRLTFTRSRPERKNDNCFVEQKNWTVVRRTVGYARYDSAHQLQLLNELYAILRLYTNFFQPNQRLVRKQRHGARLRRRYDAAQTPYQRILASPQVSAQAKAALATVYPSLNPAALRRQILHYQDALLHSLSRTPDPLQEPVEMATP